MEDERHALLTCCGHLNLQLLYAAFLNEAYALQPSLWLLQELVESRVPVVTCFTCFVFDVMAVYEGTPYHIRL